MAVRISRDRCTGCRACIEVCGVEALKIENDKAVVSEECVECGACVEQCPNKAITL